MKRPENYYLSKGFDKKAAEYYANGRRQIKDVVANNNFTLTISFDNGEKRIYDMRPLVKKGTVFEPLANIENFGRAYVDENHTIAWDLNPDIDSSKVFSNKIDLCPDSCYIDSKPM